MKARILEERPVSGKYTERWYEAKGQCTSVLFEDDTYEKWLGVFGNGDIIRDKFFLTHFPTTASVLVVAGGKGYVLDGNTGELHYQTNCDYLISAQAIPARDLIVACDFTGLYALSRDGQLWESGHIATDGIELISFSKEKISGKLWLYGEWRHFTLLLDDYSLDIGNLVED